MTDRDRTEIIARTKALLAGTTDPRNLDRIFTWLRFRSFGHKLVRDIGDFAFHMEDRDRGRTFEGSLLMSESLKLVSWTFWNLGYAQAPNVSQSELAKVALASLELKEPDWFQPNLGMKKARARNVLTSALAKTGGLRGVTGRVGGSVIQPVSELNDQERAVLGRFTGTFPDSIFDSKRLIRDFANVLERNGVIEPAEKSRILTHENLVGVYAIEKMHRRVLKISTNQNVELYAGVYENCLSVYGHFVVPWGEVESSMYTPIFTSSAGHSDWFSGHLASSGSIWEEPMIIGDDGKLRLLS